MSEYAIAAQAIIVPASRTSPFSCLAVYSNMKMTEDELNMSDFVQPADLQSRCLTSKSYCNYRYDNGSLLVWRTIRIDITPRTRITTAMAIQTNRRVVKKVACPVSA